MSKISVKNLQKSYYIGSDEYKVLKNLNIEFDSGEFVAIYGESGSGKSTFMNVVGGLDIFQSGEILIEGQNIEEFTAKSMDYYRNRKVGFVFQEFNLLDNLTLLDNVLLPMNISGLTNSQAKARAKELLIKVGLGDHIKKRITQLSGGQKQRVAIARALANDPDIILADEPTGALDSKTGVEILELLKEIALDGKCVIVITHSEKVSEYATRVVTLMDGVIVGNEMKASSEVKEVQNYHIEGDKNRLSFGKTLKIAYRNLMSKKVRTFIVAIGVSIGITGSILISSLSDSAIDEINSSFSSVETDPTQTTVFASSTEGTPINSNDATITTIEEFVGDNSGFNGVFPEYVINGDNYDEVSSQMAVTYSDFEYVTIAYGDLPKNEFEVFYDGNITNLMNLPFSDEYSDKVDLTELASININEKDDVYLKYEKLIKEDVVGQTFDMVIGGTTYTFKVVGSKNLTNFSFATTGSSLYLPYQTSTEFIDENSEKFQVNTYILDFDDEESTNEFLDEKASSSMLTPEPINGMYIIVVDVRSITSLINNIISIVRNVFLVLIGVSLVVSVFMVAVIVYISTLERKVEIGTLRALGAKKSNIANIFIGEGVFIGIISFILALITSIIGILIINFIFYVLAGMSGEFYVIELNLLALVIVFLAIVVVMLLSSIIPAMSASKQNPIDALREE